MPTDRQFDPTAALAGPPEPWAHATQPSARRGPPYHMTEMIEAEPALAGRLLGRDPASNGATQLAAAIRRCIENPALVSELGAKAREAYKGNFTMERFGKEFRESIDEVILTRTSGSPARS